MDEELEELRKKIDDIDEEIVELLEDRVEAAKGIGEIKKKKNLPLSDSEREEEVIKNVLEENKGLDEGFLKSLFRSIIEYCKDEEGR